MKGGKREGAGRKPKADEERLRDLISPYRDQTIQTVVNIMLSGEKDADRLAAAKLLLAYDFGTPKQFVEHDGELKTTTTIINLGSGKKPKDAVD